MAGALGRDESQLVPEEPARTGWRPLVALAFTTMFGIAVAVSAWVYYSQAPGVDFASFWAAGHLTLSGEPALAYDAGVHSAVEQTVAHVRDRSLPFTYPPPFLFFVAPFAVQPFWLAYLLWIGATSTLYFIATRSLLPPRYAFAHPASLINAMIGQNGFLTAGMFLFGASMVAQQPFAAGAILGLLVVKPQMAVLIPVAMLAGRHWQAIIGAAVTSMSLVVLAALVFGIDVYGAFFASIAEYAGYMADSRWKWTELASVFGFARTLGIPQSLALALQAIAAVAAAFATWRAWAMKKKQRVAVLAAATLLVPPYLFTYDSMLLIVPLAWFLADGEHRWRAVIIWILLLLPLGLYFDLYPIPNTIPLAAILSLWWLHEPKLPKLRGDNGANALKAHT